MAQASGCFLIGFHWTDNGYLVANEGFEDDESDPLLLESAQALLETLNPDGQQAESFSAPTELSKLKRAPDLYRQADGVLEDINKMRVADNNRGEKSDKNVPRHVRRHVMKVRALEEQQERLLMTRQQQEKLMRGTTDHQDDMMSCDDSAVEDEASLRLVETLNSIRIVLPKLIAMLNHPQRKDLKLEIADATIVREEKKKPPLVWLLGDHVFDMCTSNEEKRLKRNIRQVLACCCPHNTKMVDMATNNSSFCWKTFLYTCFEQQVSMAIRHPIEWIVHHPSNNNANTVTPETVLSAAKACDEWFVAPIRQDRDRNVNNWRHQQSIQGLLHKLSSIIRRKYPDTRLSIYGSCLSDLSLGKSSDVDISLYWPAALRDKRSFEAGRMDAKEYERHLKNCVYRVSDLIRKNAQSFTEIEAITRARIPLVKGKCRGSDYKFDICFLNDIAVVNSSLLREYSLVDERVKLLMLIVKEWARDHQINSAADNTLSSYAWMNLVIFYVQCLGLVPNLQSPELFVHCRFVPDRNNPYHFVNDLNTAFLTWEQVRNSGQWMPNTELANLPVSTLLYGFFYFYAVSFPQNMYAVSIRVGRCGLLKTAFRNSKLNKLCIEDPFETFHSHCPHCLGTPCTDNGQKQIWHLLETTERNLRMILQQKVAIQRDVCARNWPTHSISGKQNPVNGRQNGQKKPSGKRQRQKLRQQQQQQQQRQQNDNAHGDTKRHLQDERLESTKKKAPPRDDGGNKKRANANKSRGAKGASKKSPARGNN